MFFLRASFSERTNDFFRVPQRFNNNVDVQRERARAREWEIPLSCIQTLITVCSKGRTVGRSIRWFERRIYWTDEVHTYNKFLDRNVHGRKRKLETKRGDVVNDHYVFARTLGIIKLCDCTARRWQQQLQQQQRQKQCTLWSVSDDDDDVFMLIQRNLAHIKHRGKRERERKDK